MNLEKRLQRLEARSIADRVTLFFADGTAIDLSGPVNFVFDLLGRVVKKAELTPTEAVHANLMLRSVGSNEPGGARLVDLVRVLLHGPAAATPTSAGITR